MQSYGYGMSLEPNRASKVSDDAALDVGLPPKPKGITSRRCASRLPHRATTRVQHSLPPPRRPLPMMPLTHMCLAMSVSLCLPQPGQASPTVCC